MIEVDVQQTRDGRYLVFHDFDVKDRTGQDGLMQVMTYEEAKAINTVGDEGDPWKGSVYDPSFMPDLEEVLALASDHEVGINFDLKESVYNTASVALLAAKYPGVIERSIFQPYVPGRAEQIVAAVPEAQIMINPQFDTPPGVFFAAGAEYDWFGSDLDWFSSEVIAAIHDSCDFAQPGVYGGTEADEAARLTEAISRGADGAMVNRPHIAAEVLGKPVATSIQLNDTGACLLGHHDLGLPGKSVDVDDASITTGPGGCFSLAPKWKSIYFPGDGSALASSLTKHDIPH